MDPSNFLYFVFFYRIHLDRQQHINNINNMSASSKKTHHFDWKKIEEKPDNWEVLRHLIGICNTTDETYHDPIQTKNGHWNKIFLEIFKEKIRTKYGSVDPFFPSPSHEAETTANHTKKKGKKTANNTKDKIQKENEKKLFEKDMDMIRFDSKRFFPVNTLFRCQPTFSFMIADWNILLKKKKMMGQTIPEKEALDAMISLDRIYHEDMEEDQTMEPEIRSFFKHLVGFCGNILTKEQIYHQLFVVHPELMVNPFSQKRVGRIQYYPEQVEVLTRVVDAVVLEEPILLGDRMPPGTGKTFLAVPLAQKLASLHRKKTVLFACDNPLVRADVARLALLGHSLHLWMGRYDMNDGEDGPQFLIRPYKSCFPNTWKEVYKKEDENKTASVYQQFQYYLHQTEKQPDILVTDLQTCAELLADDRLRNHFVAYLDEFVSTPSANSIMVRITQHLPRQSVLLSAILPRFEDMPAVVDWVLASHHATREKHLVRIESNHLTISCTLLGPDGRVVLPHHYIDTVDQIPMLVKRIREDPLLGRMYAAQQVHGMVNVIKDDLVATGFSFEERFPTAGRIDHKGIRDYVLDLLIHLIPFPALFQRMREFRPTIMDPVEISKVATEQAHFFQGKTLFITNRDQIFSILDQIQQNLLVDAPDVSVMNEANMKARKELEKQLESLKESSGKPKKKIDPREHQQQINEVSEELQALRHVQWPERFIVNRPAHAAYYQHVIQKSSPLPILSEEYDSAFGTMLYRLLLSGIGVYDFSQCTEYQRRLVMKILKQLSFLFASDEIVFGTNIEGLTNLLIDAPFGERVSRNVLFQLIGRIGRVGQSYEAKIVTNSWETLNKIMSFMDAQDEDALYFQQHFSDLL